ncbi:nuclear transport factor 2 family protein [Mycobacterium sp. NPDC051804]|uniref:nuclear transport factor 2 family protein n=1 Tax=Mycobacterium sp. NPDC051804 TaxID=3364295 RepID=UPI0037BA7EEC
MDIQVAVPNPELEALSRRYAAAIDHRDIPALLSVFALDATMRVEQPGQEPGNLTGYNEIQRIIKIVDRFPRTAHVLGQGLFQVDGDHADGEVYCTAHHFSSDAGQGGDLVMHIRYIDRYAMGQDRSWRILHRTVRVDATEDRQVRGQW